MSETYSVTAVRFGWRHYDDIDLGDYSDLETAVSVAIHYWRRRGGKYGVLVTHPSRQLYVSSSLMEPEPVITTLPAAE